MRDTTSILRDSCKDDSFNESAFDAFNKWLKTLPSDTFKRDGIGVAYMSFIVGYNMREKEHNQ